jgi:hypothetical protein
MSHRIIWKSSEQAKSKGEHLKLPVALFYPYTPPFRYERLGPAIFDDKGHKVCDMRGWGFLTGTGGGLGLDEDEAAKIQDAMGQKIADLLNQVHLGED